MGYGIDMDQLVMTIDKYISHHIMETVQGNDEGNFNNIFLPSSNFSWILKLMQLDPITFPANTAQSFASMVLYHTPSPCQQRYNGKKVASAILQTWH